MIRTKRALLSAGIGTTVVTMALLAFSALPAGARVHYTNFAGYVAAPTGAATTATAMFTVPTVTCTKKAAQYESAEVDLHDADVNNDVQAFINFSCADKTASYSASADLQSGGGFTDGTITMTISPNDVIVETVTADASSSSVTIDDETTAVSQTATFAGFTAVDAGVGLDCFFKKTTCKPAIDKFGSVSFSNATVDGLAFGSEDPTEFLQKHVTTSALTSGGTAFTDTYS